MYVYTSLHLLRLNQSRITTNNTLYYICNYCGVLLWVLLFTFVIIVLPYSASLDTGVGYAYGVKCYAAFEASDGFCCFFSVV